MNHLVKLEIIGDCSDLIMIALCEFGFTSRIESELDSLFIRYSTAFMRGGYYISGRIDTNLNDYASLLIKGIRGFRQCAFDATSGETPRVAAGRTVSYGVAFLSGTLRTASNILIITSIAKERTHRIGFGDCFRFFLLTRALGRLAFFFFFARAFDG